MARGGGMLRIAHSGRAAPTRRRDRAGAGGGGGGGGGGRPRGLGGGEDRRAIQWRTEPYRATCCHLRAGAGRAQSAPPTILWSPMPCRRAPCAQAIPWFPSASRALQSRACSGVQSPTAAAAAGGGWRGRGRAVARIRGWARRQERGRDGQTRTRDGRDVTGSGAGDGGATETRVVRTRRGRGCAARDVTAPRGDVTVP